MVDMKKIYGKDLYEAVSRTYCIMALNGADLEVAPFTVCGGQEGIASAASGSTKSTAVAKEKHHGIGS